MRKFLPLIILGFVLFVYKSFFFNNQLIGGDWPYYFPEYISSFGLPGAWSHVWPTGLGGNQIVILPLKFYLQILAWIFVNNLGISWILVQKIFFFWIFIALSVFSSYKFTKSWIGVLVFSTNTWILMVASGAQVGIMLSYSLAPLVLFFIRDIINNEKTKLKKLLIASLVISAQAIFDTRISFLTLFIGFFFVLYYFLFVKKFSLKIFVRSFFIVFLTTVLLNAFWILPSLFVASKGGNVASIVDTSAGSLGFFSFAKLENSISLLHPNWPENIFGKVQFMKPEFLILPIIAFSGLLFLKKTDKKTRGTILFFALVGLIGAFFAKGVQEPFGWIFSWLYSYIPGFNLFRDPVKFYILIILSYSLLIPYSLNNLSKNLSKIFSYMFILFWIVLISPIILNPAGVFKERVVPTEYLRLGSFISSQDKFFRTLWYPSYQRFGYMSEKNPIISSQDIFKTKKLNEKKLQEMAVKYVIVPYDSEGEIFLSDRKYSEKEYLKTVHSIDKLNWLKKVKEFGKIRVYEIHDPWEHKFFISDKLIFSETYDRLWYAQVEDKKIYSKPYGMLNSFDIPQDKKEKVSLYYEPQKYTEIGYIISGLALTAVLIGISSEKMRKRLIAS